MTDALDRLKAALADRYTIERELGQGGMATVRLSQDLWHEGPGAVEGSGAQGDTLQIFHDAADLHA